MMSSKNSLIIESANLSDAWAKLFLHIIEGSGKKASTVLLTWTKTGEDQAIENPIIRNALDNSLSTIGEQSIHTVANTIFPVTLWEKVQYNRHKLYERYLVIFPRIKSLGCRKNDRGTYFQRLIAFGGDIRKGKRLDQCNGNQLEHIITGYLESQKKRLTMFQASIFDPHRDHTVAPRLGFPCLQHLQFVPDKEEKTLTVNAYYATQKVVEKAYGNYLGIYRLGDFMAHEMQLSLSQINVFIGVAQLGDCSKAKVADLAKEVKTCTKLI